MNNNTNVNVDLKFDSKELVQFYLSIVGIIINFVFIIVGAYIKKRYNIDISNLTQENTKMSEKIETLSSQISITQRSLPSINITGNAPYGDDVTDMTLTPHVVDMSDRAVDTHRDFQLQDGSILRIRKN
jgi:hypothetical protein